MWDRHTSADMACLITQPPKVLSLHNFNCFQTLLQFFFPFLLHIYHSKPHIQQPLASHYVMISHNTVQKLLLRKTLRYMLIKTEDLRILPCLQRSLKFKDSWTGKQQRLLLTQHFWFPISFSTLPSLYFLKMQTHSGFLAMGFKTCSFCLRKAINKQRHKIFILHLT